MFGKFGAWCAKHWPSLIYTKILWTGKVFRCCTSFWLVVVLISKKCYCLRLCFM